MTRQWWRTALALYTLSFCVFAINPVFLEKSPHRTEEIYADHMAHWGSALLMAFHGFDVYRSPTGKLCAHDPEAPPGIEPKDTCRLPDHPRLRTFCVNWQQYPRVYPPGAMLLAAPAAALYALTPATLSQADLLIILEYLFAAHVASLLILIALWRPAADPPGGLLSNRHWNGGVLLLILPFVHLTLVGWSLYGMYDPASILCIVAGALLLARGRPAAATVALSAAMFLHFRTLWYLPLFGVALLRTLDLPLTRRTVLALAVSAALVAPAALAFWLDWPALLSFPIRNPVHLSALEAAPRLILVHGLAPALALALLAWQGSWLTAAVVAWQQFMLVQTHEIRSWHLLFLWPWLVIAAHERRSPAIGVIAVLLLALAQARNVYGTWPISGEFIANFLP